LDNRWNCQYLIFKQAVNKVKIFDSRQNKVLLVDRIRKANAEWRQILTPEQYQVTINKGTEQPFTCTFDNIKDSGIY